MAAPERREYGTEGEGSASLPAARVARQARPTIAVEERPREAMPMVSEEAERAWARAHINDYQNGCGLGARVPAPLFPCGSKLANLLELGSLGLNQTGCATALVSTKGRDGGRR